MRGESGVSDDDLASDVLSHYSSASESASVLEEGSGTHSHMFTNTPFSQSNTSGGKKLCCCPAQVRWWMNRLLRRKLKTNSSNALTI